MKKARLPHRPVSSVPSSKQPEFSRSVPLAFIFLSSGKAWCCRLPISRPGCQAQAALLPAVHLPRKLPIFPLLCAPCPFVLWVFLICTVSPWGVIIQSPLAP